MFYIAIVQAEITDGVTDMLENETFTSVFSCQATGEPVPEITWYFNNVMINILDINYNVSTAVKEIIVTSVFTIVSAQSSDVGRYTCVAHNFIGGDQISGVLTVNGMLVCVFLVHYISVFIQMLLKSLNH